MARTGVPIVVGRSPDAGAGWAIALEQAGWSHVPVSGAARSLASDRGVAVRPSGGPAEHLGVVVTTGLATREQRAWVAAGGALVVDDARGGDTLVPAATRTAAVSGFADPIDGRAVAAPSLASLFDADGEGEVRVHDDRVVKHDLAQGRFPAVHLARVGAGVVVWSGLPMTRLLTAHGDRLRRVAPWSPVTERASTADKAGLAETLAWMVAAAARAVRTPRVRRAAWPRGAASVLCLRVDVDGAFGDRARRLGEACERADIRASYFLNRELVDAVPGDLGSWLDAHEVGQHGDVHDLFDDAAADRANLERGADWVRSLTGRDPAGFVAPRGLWSPALDAALAALGYRWSADFALATDARPFRPIGPVLQVPVHAYSPERHVRWADEAGEPRPTARDIAAHYLRHLDDQVARGRPCHVYGHPEVLGAVADQVVPAIGARAADLGLPRMTLGEIADWWAVREAAVLDAWWSRDADHLTIRRSDGRVAVEIELDRPTSVTLDGHDHGRHVGAVTLR